MIINKELFYSLLFFIALNSCVNKTQIIDKIDSFDFYYGADLSYVNEMEDCGAIYKDQQGIIKDPYQLFKESGSNLIRLRLWHNPSWTEYSNLKDVKRSIRRAKHQGIEVLLDFHYSDTWADPQRQLIPLAWKKEIDNTEKLGARLYEYTYATLVELSKEGLLPDIVQVGNEINTMLLQEDEKERPIDWDRNAYLINKGIQGVRDFNRKVEANIEVMLHIAQPENALWWFKEATTNGVLDYDWIGVSYYPVWSIYTLKNVSQPLKELITTFKKKLMVVETAYPFTFINNDKANNILDNKALIEGFPASQKGQLAYLLALEQEIRKAGGEGLIYWEPAWVSTPCHTQWGQGSHWDNATLFDHSGKATLALGFYERSKK